MAHTVNGIAPGDLGLTGLVLHYANMDDDYCDIEFPLTFDAALNAQFEEGKAVVVRDGGTVVFRGVCEAAAISATGRSQRRTVRVWGPWHGMRTEYLNTADFGWMTPKVVLFSASVEDQLRTVIGRSAAAAVGDIEAGGSVPARTEYDGMTLAGAVQAILANVRGAVVWFDYAPAKPTCNVALAARGRTARVSVRGGNVASLSCRKRDDLRIPSLTISHIFDERFHDGRFDGLGANTIDSPADAGREERLARIDQASDGSGFTQTSRYIVHRLSGERIVRRYAATLAFRKFAFKTDSYSLPTSPANVNQYAYMTDRAKNNRANFLLLAQLIDVGGATLLCTDSDLGKRQYHYYERLVVSGAVGNNTFAVLPKGKAFATGTSSGQRIGQKTVLPLRCTEIPAVVRARFGIEEFTVSGTFLPSMGFSTSAVAEGSFAGCTGGAEGDRTVSWETVEDTREAVPGDCAASIIAAANRTYYDISLVLTGQESNPFYCKRDIEIPEIGASSPIQGVTHDILQERVTLQAGPPAQISVQDYLTIAGF